jgi:hypothetical protein
MAARITASCQSNGMDSERTQSRQKSTVLSRKALAVASVSDRSGSSSPKKKDRGLSTTKGRSSLM